jgi:glycosyltransferase involved in cell wall biosynthesis
MNSQGELDAERRFRILLVGMPDSIHVARWLLANKANHLEIMLFASSPMRKCHPVIKDLLQGHDVSIASRRLILRRHFFSFAFAIALWILDRRFLFDGRVRGFFISLAVRRFKPDLVHTMESQQGGYATYHGLRGPEPRPKTLLTLFGSDLFWFSRFKYHKGRLKDLLGVTDFIQAECARDELLAKSLDFNGEFLPLLPVSAGLPIREVATAPTLAEIQGRKVIAIKGYGGKWGLAVQAIDALSIIRDEISGYTIELYSCEKRVAKHALDVFRGTEVIVKTHPKFALSHSQMLGLFRRSKIAIGLSRSDGLPASMLEAMSQGAFPVQTSTACIEGWIKDGVSGLVVEEPNATNLAARMKSLLGANEKLKRAADTNTKTIESKYSDSSIQESAARIYAIVLNDRNF